VAYIAFASAKGSPGVTTTVTALAAAWPAERALLVAEADPSGGDLVVRLDLATEPGLVSLAAAGRRELDADRLLEHTQALAAPGGAAEAVRRVLVAPVSAEQATASLTALRGGLGRVLDDVAFDVLVDCGRLDPSSPAFDLAVNGALLVMVARPVVAEVHHLSSRLASAKPRAVSVLMVGDKPYSVSEVSEAVGASPLGTLPVDLRAAAVLSEGHPQAARLLRRASLLRDARALAEGLCDWLGPQAGSPSPTAAQPSMSPPSPAGPSSPFASSPDSTGSSSPFASSPDSTGSSSPFASSPDSTGSASPFASSPTSAGPASPAGPPTATPSATDLPPPRSAPVPLPPPASRGAGAGAPATGAPTAGTRPAPQPPPARFTPTLPDDRGARLAAATATPARPPVPPAPDDRPPVPPAPEGWPSAPSPSDGWPAADAHAPGSWPPVPPAPEGWPSATTSAGDHAPSGPPPAPAPTPGGSGDSWAAAPAPDDARSARPNGRRRLGAAPKHFRRSPEESGP
jgi:hypothetical protein